MKTYTVLNYVPRHYGSSCAWLSTTLWRCILYLINYHVVNMYHIPKYDVVKTYHVLN